MNKINTAADLREQDILTIEVTDQALEAAASTGTDNLKSFTVTMCTGQVDCPFAN